MAEWLRLVVDSLETWVRVLHGFESFLRRGRFTWHWHARFLYCCALCNVFFLGIRQWQSHTDRVLTLNMNIRHPLFWSTWSPARGPDSATCAGLAHGRDYSDCRASELKLQKFLASAISWILEIKFKWWPTERIFRTSPPGLQCSKEVLTAQWYWLSQSEVKF